MSASDESLPRCILCTQSALSDEERDLQVLMASLAQNAEVDEGTLEGIALQYFDHVVTREEIPRMTRAAVLTHAGHLRPAPSAPVVEDVNAARMTSLLAPFQGAWAQEMANQASVEQQARFPTLPFDSEAK